MTTKWFAFFFAPGALAAVVPPPWPNAQGRMPGREIPTERPPSAAFLAHQRRRATGDLEQALSSSGNVGATGRLLLLKSDRDAEEGEGDQHQVQVQQEELFPQTARGDVGALFESAPDPLDLADQVDPSVAPEQQAQSRSETPSTSSSYSCVSAASDCPHVGRQGPPLQLCCPVRVKFERGAGVPLSEPLKRFCIFSYRSQVRMHRTNAKEDAAAGPWEGPAWLTAGRSRQLPCVRGQERTRQGVDEIMESEGHNVHLRSCFFNPGAQRSDNDGASAKMNYDAEELYFADGLQSQVGAPGKTEETSEVDPAALTRAGTSAGSTSSRSHASTFASFASSFSPLDRSWASSGSGGSTFRAEARRAGGTGSLTASDQVAGRRPLRLDRNDAEDEAEAAQPRRFPAPPGVESGATAAVREHEVIDLGQRTTAPDLQHEDGTPLSSASGTGRTRFPVENGTCSDSNFWQRFFSSGGDALQEQEQQCENLRATTPPGIACGRTRVGSAEELLLRRRPRDGHGDWLTRSTTTSGRVQVLHSSRSNQKLGRCDLYCAADPLPDAFETRSAFTFRSDDSSKYPTATAAAAPPTWPGTFAGQSSARLLRRGRRSDTPAPRDRAVGASIEAAPLPDADGPKVDRSRCCMCPLMCFFREQPSDSGDPGAAPSDVVLLAAAALASHGPPGTDEGNYCANPINPYQFDAAYGCNEILSPLLSSSSGAPARARPENTCFVYIEYGSCLVCWEFLYESVCDWIRLFAEAVSNFT